MSLLAYFDPGSGSLLAQALVGGAAGLMVLFRYMWDRIRYRNSNSVPANSSSTNTLVKS